VSGRGAFGSERRGASARASQPGPAPCAQVTVGALLPPELIAHAEADLDATAVVVPVRGGQDLHHLVGGISSGVMLVEPAAYLAADEGGRWLRDGQPGWITVLYCRADAPDVARLLDCMTVRPTPVVLSGWRPSRLAPRTLLEERAAMQRGAALLGLFARRLMPLHAPLAAHIAAMFASPNGASSFKELAWRSAEPESSARRRIGSIGIRSRRRLIAASRVSRAWDDVANEAHSLSEIARRHGFGTRRALRHQWSDVTGATIETALGVPFGGVICESIVERLLETPT
jgi:hypothetical protein